MAKTIIVVGLGPGISSAVAERFGAEGFQLALVARNSERLDAAVAAFAAKGVKAQAFPTDVSDPEAVRALVGKVQAALGPVTAIHWNAYGGGAGDILSAEVSEIRAVYDIAVTSLVTAVQASLSDLEAQSGAVLVTNGALGFFDPQVDAMGVAWNAMGLSIANSAKHKAVALLGEKLKDKVYVGEVVVTGLVKGTAFDQGNATLDPHDIATKFWELFTARAPRSVVI